MLHMLNVKRKAQSKHHICLKHTHPPTHTAHTLSSIFEPCIDSLVTEPTEPLHASGLLSTSNLTQLPAFWTTWQAHLYYASSGEVKFSVSGGVVVRGGDTTNVGADPHRPSPPPPPFLRQHRLASAFRRSPHRCVDGRGTSAGCRAHFER